MICIADSTNLELKSARQGGCLRATFLRCAPVTLVRKQIVHYENRQARH
jgi:hypothetical protein